MLLHACMPQEVVLKPSHVYHADLYVTFGQLRIFTQFLVGSELVPV